MQVPTTLVTVAGVVVILQGTLGFLALDAARGGTVRPGRARAPSERVATGAMPADVVGRYAVFEGTVVGEVVREEGGDLVLRQAGVERRAARATSRIEGDEVVLAERPRDGA